MEAVKVSISIVLIFILLEHQTWFTNIILFYNLKSIDTIGYTIIYFIESYNRHTFLKFLKILIKKFF